MDRLTKSFPVFDCDAHINDPLAVWDYVPSSKQELVRQTYWRSESEAWLNGVTPTLGGGNEQFPNSYNPICIAGPQMNKKIMRKLLSMVPLSDEQRRYVHHDGALDPHARIKEMDLMGIDQVLVIPTMVISNLPYAENAEGVEVFCQAYNDFLVDWCKEVPERLFGAALLPVQDPERAAKEIYRASELGHRVALIRPIDAQGKYPNLLSSALSGEAATYDAVFRAFEETGLVLGMHTFPAGRLASHPRGSDYLDSPGELFGLAGTDSQTFSFIHEAQSWLTQVLMSGLLDRFPRLKMAVFESNAVWLPTVLTACDRLWKLYASERETPGDRLPSEAFHDQSVISFESDEEGVFRQWRDFEDIGIWASDAYHHDGADVWSAMRMMTDCDVPAPVQARLLGANAANWYSIEPQVFVTQEADPIDRPDWFPQGPELEEWADLVAHPRENAQRLADLHEMRDPSRIAQRIGPAGAGGGY